MARYLKNYWDEKLGKELFNDVYSWKSENGKGKAVNFYVLIELFVFFQLQESGVKPKRILEARKNIAKETHTQYPFATLEILNDSRKIWYKTGDSVIDADGTRQINFEQIINDFVKKIEFNEQHEAVKFYPKGTDSCIVVSPHNQFGQPVIEGTNINAEMIFSMYKSGEPIELIEHLYNLKTKEVIEVIEFYKSAA